jgi:hypothetical protein
VEVKLSAVPAKGGRPGFAVTLSVLAALTVLLFGAGFLPDHTLFSNDGPLGRLMSQCHRLPERFFGCWQDLDGIGYSEGSASPSISFGLQWLLGPLWFSRLYTPLSLVILGSAAWFFSRNSGLATAACFLGAVAAMLNSTFFSTACWGLGAHTLAIAMSFLALAALVDASPRGRWVRVILAGLAVGMAVMEGADVGALMSLYVAAFIVWQAMSSEGSNSKRIGIGAARLTLVAVCAALLAARGISELVATNITGVAGVQQDAATRAERWDWATQWSLPKKEALGIVVPGLFGYRMDALNGGRYWGEIGRSRDWRDFLANGSQGNPPTSFIRYSGNGFYAGVPVVLLALWAGLEALRRKNAIFSAPQQKCLWFWLGTGVASLLLAFGRFAPFYHLVYALPYFSTIRNPTKFLNLFSFALVIVFAYGVDGLVRRYFRPAPGTSAASRWPGFVTWWAKASLNEKRWVQVCVVVLAVSLLGWLSYSGSSHALEEYLEKVRFKGFLPHSIASFSIRQVGWFVLFWVLAAGFLALTFSGAFAGRRAPLGVVLLSAVTVLDLGRANLSWIVVWNYDDRYATNAIIDKLKEHPDEQRVAISPFRPPPQLSGLYWLYESGWLEHQFPYYNIQSLNLVQMSRMPMDLKAYGAAMTPPAGNEADTVRIIGRRWMLTNTRYILGPLSLEEFLEKIDPVKRRFRVVQRFNVGPKPGIAQTSNADEMMISLDPDGIYALFEFDAALPRAKLYTNWQVNTNSQVVLDRLVDLSFDPDQTVLVSGDVPAPPPSASTSGEPSGTVETVSYASKHVVLKCNAPQASVLLLNDHIAPHWYAWVDGQPRPVLRCNSVMRGVYIDPGAHNVEFRYQPPVGSLYVSLASIGVGLGLLGLLNVSGFRRRSTAAPVPQARPEPKPATDAPRRPAPASGRGKRLTAKGAR